MVKSFFDKSFLTGITWIFLVISFFSILITSVCIIGAVDHRSFKTTVITAYITDVEMYSHGGGKNSKDTGGYKLYVDYTYNGEKYHHIFYGTEDNSDKAQVGRKVFVRFYKDYPSALVRNSDNILFIALPVTLIVIGFTVYFIKCDVSNNRHKHSKHHHRKSKKIKRKIRHFINKRRFKQNKLNKHRR